MQIICPECKETLTQSGNVPPKFCSHCGASLSTVSATRGTQATPQETMTIRRLVAPLSSSPQTPDVTFWSPAEETTTRVDEGAELNLRVTAGPILIERQVSAIQSAGLGDTLFVQTETREALRVQLVSNSDVVPAGEWR